MKSFIAASLSTCATDSIVSENRMSALIATMRMTLKRNAVVAKQICDEPEELCDERNYWRRGPEFEGCGVNAR